MDEARTSQQKNDERETWRKKARDVDAGMCDCRLMMSDIDVEAADNAGESGLMMVLEKWTTRRISYVGKQFLESQNKCCRCSSEVNPIGCQSYRRLVWT